MYFLTLTKVRYVQNNIKITYLTCNDFLIKHTTNTKNKYKPIARIIQKPYVIPLVFGGIGISVAYIKYCFKHFIHKQHTTFKKLSKGV